MKSLVGGLILLTSVNSTAVIAGEDFITMPCVAQSGEMFTIFVKGNDAVIKWPQGTYPAQIEVQGSRIYLLEKGEYGTMGIVYDMEAGVGHAVTKFNDGRVVNNTIKCSIN